MNYCDVVLTEGLNLITFRDIEIPLEQLVTLADSGKISIISANAKPSGTIDLLVSITDDMLNMTSFFGSNTKQYKAQLIRRGICCISVTTDNPREIISKSIAFLEQRKIAPERIMASEREIQIFFPSSEICGNILDFKSDFENFLLT